MKNVEEEVGVGEGDGGLEEMLWGRERKSRSR